MSDEMKTPLLDELEKGPWPSFVTDLKRLTERKPAVKDVLGQLEKSYSQKLGHWKHGGIVGVKGYGGGVIGRYSDLPEEFPNVAEFHTMRINQPSGWFYNTDALRDIMKTWDKYGSGITNMHGATGDIVLVGMPTQNLQPAFDEFAEKGWDLGGSGSCLRSPSCCVGPARCEHACIDTLDICYNLTQEFQDELHRPMWPYKFKIKVSGCSNDCVSAVARADMSIIGTWRDSLKIDHDKVRTYANSGFDIKGMVVDKCPTSALNWDGKTLTLKSEECVRCMQCINMMPKALSIGQERGATLLIGGKSTILKSAFLSWVLVPFMKMEPPYDEIKDLLRKIWEWWDENGKVRERVGELIYRKGMREFLRAVDLEAIPQMVSAPRANPYFFWWPEDLNK